MNKGVIEQLGTPREIYNDPRTLFVAGFIGSPPMNLIPGEVRNGVFVSASLSVGGIGQVNLSRAVLGVRSEDVHPTEAADADVNLVAPIYSVELTGENTLVSLRLGGQLMTLRADKNFTGQIDQQIGVKVATDRVFLFNGETQDRVDF
jgi:multiple sugar transport system ATP-binding protein